MLRTVMRPILWTAAGVLLALPAPAADTTGEDISITDPALLEQLGFEPDATNVYATRRAYERLLISPEEQAALQEAQLAERLAEKEAATAAGAYGFNTAGFSSVAPSMMRPIFGSTDFSTAPWGIWCVSGNAVLQGQLLDLPHGARLEFIDFWLFDASDEHINGEVYEVCLPDLGAGEPSWTLLGDVDTVGNSGNGFYTFPVGNRPVDVESCQYAVRVRLDDGSNCSEHSDLIFRKARAQWRRQVSPAPATATFDDVPASHLFFQQIEALVDSGITAGCGGGDFCPNAPLTRGQMAAFLAKALGLHWGVISQD